MSSLFMRFVDLTTRTRHVKNAYRFGSDNCAGGRYLRNVDKFYQSTQRHIPDYRNLPSISFLCVCHIFSTEYTIIIIVNVYILLIASKLLHYYYYY